MHVSFSLENFCSHIVHGSTWYCLILEPNWCPLHAQTQLLLTSWWLLFHRFECDDDDTRIRFMFLSTIAHDNLNNQDFLKNYSDFLDIQSPEESEYVISIAYRDQTQNFKPKCQSFVSFWNWNWFLVLTHPLVNTVSALIFWRLLISVVERQKQLKSGKVIRQRLNYLFDDTFIHKIFFIISRLDRVNWLWFVSIWLFQALFRVVSMIFFGRLSSECAYYYKT